MFYDLPERDDEDEQIQHGFYEVEQEKYKNDINEDIKIALDISYERDIFYIDKETKKPMNVYLYYK